MAYTKLVSPKICVDSGEEGYSPFDIINPAKLAV